MTEEEKKAISIVENIKFKKYKIYIAKEMKDEIRFYQTEEERKAIDIVLNLIEKLQKEIEELRKLAEFQKGYRKKLEQDLFENCSNFVVSKDKIREYIKEKEEEKEGVKNISLEEYAITSKELKESEICLLKCLLEEK